MSTDIAAAVRMLTDRQEITERLLAYTRGLDRCDRELLLSAYHPDAIDDHGVFVGSPSEYADWSFAYYHEHQFSNSHTLTNIQIELDGDVADVESHWFSAAMSEPDRTLSILGGRYIDRFERRDGRWGIAARKCVVDWHGEPGPSPIPAEALASLNDAGRPARDRSDPVYQRPVRIDTDRLGHRSEHPHFKDG